MKSPRARLIISFTVLGLFILGSFLFYAQVKSGSQIGGAPTALRNSFLFNEKVTRILFSAKRMSVKRPTPPADKKPRVNGSIGLKTPLKLEGYAIQVMTPERNFSVPIAVFQTLPKRGYTTEFRCVEGWSEDTQYAGTRFSEFMEKYDLGKKPNGQYYKYVGLETPDGQYYVSIDMESMMHEQTLLAYEMNLQPLSVENGNPIRLIIPIKYGIKSLKRIGKIFFSDERPRDYWADRGYDWYSGL